MNSEGIWKIDSVVQNVPFYFSYNSLLSNHSVWSNSTKKSCSWVAL